MAVPVNDFFLSVVGKAKTAAVKYPAPKKPGGIKGIFSRKPKGTSATLTEVVDNLKQDIAEADLGSVTFRYGKGTVGSEGNILSLFSGTPEPAKLEITGSEVLARTVGIVSTSEDYAQIGIGSGKLDYAHHIDIDYGDRKTKLEAFFNAENVNADLTNVDSLLAFSPESISAEDGLGTVLHEFTHSANSSARFTGGEAVENSYDIFGSALNDLLDSDYKPLNDWMPSFQQNLNLSYAHKGVEEARAELGRLSFLGHPSENISTKIDPDYISYIGRVSGEGANLKTDGSAYRSGYTDWYEEHLRNFTPQAYKDPTTGLVMDETEKWIQASLREAEMNAHAAGVMTILHNSEHIPGFEQQRALMQQLFEEEQKNNPQYGRIVENLRQTMFEPGNEPAFRVDIPGAKWLDTTGDIVPEATLEAVTPAEVAIEEISPGVTKAGDVYTFIGDDLPPGSVVGAGVGETVEDIAGSTTTVGAVGDIVGAVGGGAGAAVTSTATTTAAGAATGVATTATTAAAGAGTRTAAAAGKNVSEELVKGFKNVDNIRMAGVAAILGVGALAYSSRRRD